MATSPLEEIASRYAKTEREFRKPHARLEDFVKYGIC
jgi:hypothetical protein